MDRERILSEVRLVLAELKGDEAGWIPALWEIHEQTVVGEALVARIIRRLPQQTAVKTAVEMVGAVIAVCEAELNRLKHEYERPWEIRLNGYPVATAATFAQAQARAEGIRKLLAPRSREVVTVGRVALTPGPLPGGEGDEQQTQVQEGDEDYGTV